MISPCLIINYDWKLARTLNVYQQIILLFVLRTRNNPGNICVENKLKENSEKMKEMLKQNSNISLSKSQCEGFVAPVGKKAYCKLLVSPVTAVLSVLRARSSSMWWLLIYVNRDYYHQQRKNDICVFSEGIWLKKIWTFFNLIFCFCSNVPWMGRSGFLASLMHFHSQINSF